MLLLVLPGKPTHVTASIDTLVDSNPNGWFMGGSLSAALLFKDCLWGLRRGDVSESGYVFRN